VTQDSEALDVVIVSDPRFSGGTSSAMAEEIRTLTEAGRKVGFWRVSTPWWRDDDREVHPLLQAHIDAGRVRIIDPTETVRVPLVLAEHPVVFRRLPRGRWPRLVADLAVIVGHHPVTGPDGRLIYDPWWITRNCRRLFTAPVVWGPISPTNRASFAAFRASLPMLKADWTNILRAGDWGQPRRHGGGRPFVIGRHSRDAPEKWPTTREDFLAAYPDDPQIEVRLLGYSAAFDRIVGRRPGNWVCLPFNAVPAAAFLRTIDFFVYFHAPYWREAFGRTIAEAIGSGAVVILPESFRESFGPAAVYATPQQAVAVARRLWSEPEAYERQSRIAWDWLQQNYGPDAYLATLDRAMAAAATGALGEVVDLPTASQWAPGVVGMRARFYAEKALSVLGDRLRPLLRRFHQARG